MSWEVSMNNKIGFVGHRNIVESKIRSKLYTTIENFIKEGNFSFIMGNKGDFDHLVIECCKKLKTPYPNINIDVVITSFNQAKKYEINDINYIMYDIENIHFKRRIIESNYSFINECKILVCYVDETRNNSGAKRILNYAKKKGLIIINLYDDNDNPLNNLDIKEASKYCDDILAKIKKSY